MKTSKTKAVVRTDPGPPPAWIEKTRELLANAKTLDEVLHVRDSAKAAQTYFQAAKDTRGHAKIAAEIRLRAERKAGWILIETREKGQRRGQGGDQKSKLHDVSLIADLAKLRIEPVQSHRWQQIARVPEELFEEYIAEALMNLMHELTTSGLTTAAKFHQREETAETLRADPAPLPEGPYRVIVADPPWPYAERRPTINDSRGYPAYSGMTMDEIRALPVGNLAHEDSTLWLWTTNAFLEESFDLCRCWGFRYRTLLTWAKNKIGLGDWLRGQTEHCMFASKGSPALTLSNQSTLLSANVRDHSRKPDEFYALVESLCPAPPEGRIDIFARAPREGWRVWGNESGS